jgi:hypothetical protein
MPHCSFPNHLAVGVRKFLLAGSSGLLLRLTFQRQLGIEGGLVYGRATP